MHSCLSFIHQLLWNYKLNLTMDPKFESVATEVCRSTLSEVCVCVCVHHMVQGWPRPSNRATNKSPRVDDRSPLFCLHSSFPVDVLTLHSQFAMCMSRM